MNNFWMDKKKKNSLYTVQLHKQFLGLVMMMMNHSKECLHNIKLIHMYKNHQIMRMKLKFIEIFIKIQCSLRELQNHLVIIINNLS